MNKDVVRFVALCMGCILIILLTTCNSNILGDGYE